MIHARWSVILVAGCAIAAPSGRDVVESTGDAMRRGAAIEDVQTIVLEGGGEEKSFGQSPTLDGALDSWRITEQRRSIDVARRQWREELVAMPLHPRNWPDPKRYVAGYDDGVAFDADDGAQQRASSDAARERRAMLYHHPLVFLRAARAPGAVLANARRAGDRDAVDLVAAGGERYTLFVDRATRLPARIASTGHDVVLGDIAVTTDFADFATADGWTVPGRMTRRIDGVVVSDFRIAKTRINAPVGALAATAEVRAARADAPARVVVEEVAPGVWYLTGQRHHSVVVEFADHLVLIEAPAGDARTLAVIERARALRPGKPLTRVINTHHHFDHAAGIRAAIAEGLQVITHETNRRFFEQVAARPRTVSPDALAKRPRPLSIDAVADHKVLADETRRIEIYPITGSRHCPTNLMIYLRAEKLLVFADMYEAPPLQGPRPPSYPHAANLVENVERRGLAVERIAPLHGRIVPYADLLAAAGR